MVRELGVLLHFIYTPSLEFFSSFRDSIMTTQNTAAVDPNTNKAVMVLNQPTPILLMAGRHTAVPTAAIA